MIPTYDFNNVVRPVPTQDEALSIPAVTGLLYTPVFVNPTLLGAIGGYYNSVYGVTVTLAPTKNSYLNYGFYDGNVARGAERNVQPPVLKSFVLPIPSQQVDVVSRRAVQSKARVVSGKSFEILYSLKANDWPFGNVSM